MQEGHAGLHANRDAPCRRPAAGCSLVRNVAVLEGTCLVTLYLNQSSLNEVMSGGCYTAPADFA
jgi:hypothetical protein